MLSVKSGVALAVLLVSAGSLPAQDAVLADLYGRGVHHYFSGDLGQAVGDLTDAINGGTRDPRAYYFRALAQMRMGQQANATADLRQGAALESADVNQSYPVGKSLERVQGANRMTLERFRAVARAESYQRRHERDLLRYEQRRRAESEVLRSSATAPVAAPPAAAAPEPADDPFADKPQPVPAEKPAADAQPAAEKEPAADPFGDEPPPQGDEEMKADEPAEAEGDKPAAEAPAADTKSEEDPFADDPKE